MILTMTKDRSTRWSTPVITQTLARVPPTPGPQGGSPRGLEEVALGRVATRLVGRLARGDVFREGPRPPVLRTVVETPAVGPTHVRPLAVQVETVGPYRGPQEEGGEVPGQFDLDKIVSRYGPSFGQLGHGKGSFVLVM